MYLYIGCNGHVVAINPSDGSEVWRTPLPAGLFGSAALVDVTVLEYEGRVLAGSNGHLFAMDGKLERCSGTISLRGSVTTM